MAGLNFTGNDSAVMLHFALFSGSGGFVLKPSEMRMESPDGGSFRDAPPESPRNHRRRSAVYRVTSADVSRQADNDVHWPPPRVMLACVSVRVISLHNLPKVCHEKRGVRSCVRGCREWRCLKHAFGPLIVCSTASNARVSMVDAEQHTNIIQN
jgi:hypothetical protein